LFVNTSLAEGFPNTFIQAWMRGMPVASLHVNPDDVLEREQVGFCAGTPEQLAATVRRLMTDDSLREAYGARAREYAIETHSLRNVGRLTSIIDGARTRH
jgi:glycosyltransferase involved in cell wall biosynthesis